MWTPSLGGGSGRVIAAIASDHDPTTFDDDYEDPHQFINRLEQMAYRLRVNR